MNDETKPDLSSDSTTAPTTAPQSTKRHRKTTSPATPAAKPKSNAQKRSRLTAFPRIPAPVVTLEDSLVIPKLIEENHYGSRASVDDLAKEIGFGKTTDARLNHLLRSAELYGLVSLEIKTDMVLLAPIGLNVVAPSSSQERQDALLAAFLNVGDYRRIYNHYGLEGIPEGEYFINTLIRQFDIPRYRASRFADIYRANLSFLRSFDIRARTDPEILDHPETQAAGAIIPRSQGKQDRGPREFLDICFVMMPFGGWFDRYYQDIYVPAIKDAGLEPVRADELFSTGSVMEQIWEQISKAKVLLADLTDKNANVFYELGLAHAAVKPVVFTSAKVEDVPFDLRHLRVIIYDTREPDWSSKLRQHITDYLRNTIKEPSKSVSKMS